MTRTDLLNEILSSVRSGKMPVEEAMQRLRSLSYEDLGFAKIDHDRSLRAGFPEVVFCEGKTPEQVVEILKRLCARHPTVMATRAAPEVYESVRREVPKAHYHETPRMITVQSHARKVRKASDRTDKNYILVVSAGTADIPVAEEAAVTAETMGSRVERVYDVGVAGLHRLLDQKEKLEAAKVLIVVAGMEGALPSVVGGLVSKPVIAVPTSVGYGASFEGLAALLSMLNSCAEGVAVVNIDNGFGAGYFAHLINR